MDATSSSSSSAVIDALSRRGWCFANIDYMKAMISEISSVVDADCGARAVVDSVEAELLNMDIRSFGAKSLPDPAELRRCSHLQGPKVLQISSVRDITRSSEDLMGSSSAKRLLRLTLTDGHTEISALEFSHVPAIPDDVAPGTKLHLDNKAVVRNGLVCLTPKEVKVLGGVVKSLYEEWQMKRKYFGMSRKSGRKSQENGAGSCPPPFEELKIQTGSHHLDNKKPISRSTPTVAESAEKRTNLERAETSEANMVRKGANNNLLRDAVEINSQASLQGKTQEKPSSSETRPKQVVEAVPIQNQAAAQILLQKMKHPNSNERQYRGGRRGRGRGRHEQESRVLTLDEWEKRNTSAVPPQTGQPNDTCHDEDLAWQLQNQFDLEDSHESYGTGTEDIRVSMFNYGRRPDDNFGRGRGRGRRRGRGRF
ncbi:PREDICTED: tudor domain-containing protein 3 isoform X2 [Tarenaya hassleriana]|uniref:tudor domain-containing protein 3 isoform X2 n=1 Tax=Tarenaya hassleriana TaxID=28532 RepID=UPI00053C817C|nr:PREDICTED: tudor domain-containing protein 3 isoform X2 [Tarenaya hassleriana]